jgi:glycosyltransferase involved in cell wall biosynthesis
VKITVITVAYNSASTIADTVRSVASQTYSDIEHLVIDGQSTDGTVQVVEAHRHPRLVLSSEPDSGIYDAMNKGLDRASGDIVCFLNADDQYASPHVLSRVAAQMRAHRLDALMGDVGFFRGQDSTRIVRRYRSDRFHPDRLAWGWMPAHPALFMRSEVVQRVGHFKTDYRIAGDFEFIVRAFRGHDLRYRHLPEMLVLMRTGGVSTSGLRAKLLLNREVLRACRENGLRTNVFKILSKYPAKMVEFFHR